MTYTEKYRLNVPALTDKANVTKISENFTAIDGIISGLSDDLEQEKTKLEVLKEEVETNTSRIEAAENSIAVEIPDRIQVVEGTANEAFSVSYNALSEIGNFKTEQLQTNENLDNSIKSVESSLESKLDNFKNEQSQINKDLNNFKEEQSQWNEAYEEFSTVIENDLYRVENKFDAAIGDINSILATVVSGGAE